MTGDSNLHRKESAAIIIVGSCYLIHRGWSGKHKPKPPLGSPAPNLPSQLSFLRCIYSSYNIFPDNEDHFEGKFLSAILLVLHG